MDRHWIATPYTSGEAQYADVQAHRARIRIAEGIAVQLISRPRVTRSACASSSTLRNRLQGLGRGSAIAVTSPCIQDSPGTIFRKSIAAKSV